jgi:NitT/TauT family transport system permease protein
MAERWFVVRRELSPRRQGFLTCCAFILPLLLWCVISYVPFVWHPLITITAPGGSEFLVNDMMVERQIFADENAKLVQADKPLATGYRSNPVFLPPPHAVAAALYTGFLTEPKRRGEPWLHESLWHSLTIIFYGFTAAAILGVPIGIMCGTFAFFSRLIEPFVDFIRYMPAPAFGALMVAVWGINDGPKIAIIFIGTFFQLVLVVANTTRQIDHSLLEAAQTLGAKGRHLVTLVVLPGILPILYVDLRILLGWGWSYLIVAELLGGGSGMS